MTLVLAECVAEKLRTSLRHIFFICKVDNSDGDNCDYDEIINVIWSLWGLIRYGAQRTQHNAWHLVLKTVNYYYIASCIPLCSNQMKYSFSFKWNLALCHCNAKHLLVLTLLPGRFSSYIPLPSSHASSPFSLVPVNTLIHPSRHSPNGTMKWHWPNEVFPKLFKLWPLTPLNLHVFLLFLVKDQIKHIPHLMAH